MMDEEMIKHNPDKPMHQGWYLDKRISIAHIFATLSFAFALGTVMYAIETRVTVVEQRVTTHEAVTTVELNSIKERDRNMLIEMNRHYMEIKDSLIRIEDQLDRHSENTVTHGRSSSG